MIYIDSSVALVYLLSEDRSPSPLLWRERLISSRLLQFEVWTRIHARGLSHSHSQPVELLLKRIPLVEMALPVLTRALKPFPKPIRTLDARRQAHRGGSTHGVFAGRYLSRRAAESRGTPLPVDLRLWRHQLAPICSAALIEVLWRPALPTTCCTDS